MVQIVSLSIALNVGLVWMVINMDAKNEINNWLDAHNLTIRICNGAVTFCNGDCDSCEDYDDEEDDE